LPLLFVALTVGLGQAQQEPADVSPSAVAPDAEPMFDDPAELAAADPAAAQPQRSELDAITLLFAGGILMIPIGLFSLIAVAVTIERLISMRRGRVIPRKLVDGLTAMSDAGGALDPRAAYRLCQEHPSAAARVIHAMLLKVGRPHSEVEHAVAEASQREAERMYANVRWLNLTAAVAPLLGLLGTVQGMIQAFHDTTQLPPGMNKADFLAEGIYIALVTTFAGLCVAIPAAIASHWFEGRIQSLFHEIDELLFNLLPAVERYEGRVRFSQAAASTSDAARRAAERRGAGV
jgi:biopolymer transport protein ExbB